MYSIEQGSWIWSSEVQGRNLWQMFRRTFTCSDTINKTATCEITADSRYSLCVNGKLVGRGPVRYYQEEIPFDTYDIAPFLQAGKNVLTVLVRHFGISTFQYRLGTPALLFSVYGTLCNFCSDEEVKTKEFCGTLTNAPRSCVQQDFSEYIDATAIDENWTLADYDDSDWNNATAISSCEKHSTHLTPNELPQFTTQEIYPTKVIELKAKKAIPFTAIVDYRDSLIPNCEQNCNGIIHQVVVATSLVSQVKQIVTIFMEGGRFHPFCVNGHWYRVEDALDYCYPEISVQVYEGENRFYFDCSGQDHLPGLHFGISGTSNFAVKNPFFVDSQTDFCLLGPFGTPSYYIDFKPAPQPPISKDYEHCLALVTRDDVAAMSAYARRLRSEQVCLHDAFLLCVAKTPARRISVPNSLQNLTQKNSAYSSIPIFPEENTLFTLDFGEEVSGYLSFTLECAQKAVLDFYPFEYLDFDMPQDTFGYEGILHYRAKFGKQKYRSEIRRGFRYLTVRVNSNSPVKIKDIHITQYAYPYNDIGDFKCSDYELNAIFDICKRTVKLCTEDTYVDCPCYEQVFWVGDSRNESLINYYLFGSHEIVRHCLRLAAQSKIQTEFLNDHLPSGWDSVIPNWTFCLISAILEYYDYSSDSEFLAEMQPAISNTIDRFLQELNSDGLLSINSWNLFDWAECDQPNSGIVSHQNMFLLQALNQLIRINDILGITAHKYIPIAKKLKLSINKYLWCDENKAYLDCIHSDGTPSTIWSIQTQAAAYLCKAYDSDKKKSALEQNIKNPPKDYVQVGSPFMSFFLYECLEQMGETQQLIADIKDNFGTMLKLGATTCWEQYANSPLNKIVPEQLSRSHCHAWSAGPAYFLMRNVLGIKPLDTGWKTISVNPCTSTEWVCGTLPLPQGGFIKVKYSSSHGKQKLNILAPKNIKILTEVKGAEVCFIEN